MLSAQRYQIGTVISCSAHAEEGQRDQRERPGEQEMALLLPERRVADDVHAPVPEAASA